MITVLRFYPAARARAYRREPDTTLSKDFPAIAITYLNYPGNRLILDCEADFSRFEHSKHCITTLKSGLSLSTSGLWVEWDSQFRCTPLSVDDVFCLPGPWLY